MERLQLVGVVSDDLFARELLVRVVAKHNEAGFPEVELERLDDDGRQLETADQEVTLDPDGLIIGQKWDERGYLMGGVPAGPDGFNLTKAELFTPVMIRPIQAVAQRSIQLPSAA